MHASEKEKVDLKKATPAELERVRASAKQARFERNQKRILAIGFTFLFTVAFIFAFLYGFDYLMN